MNIGNLDKFQKILQQKKIDFYIVANSDQFFLEYLPEYEKKIEFLSGFSGSNAFLIIAPNKTYFFTDKRYTLQATNQFKNVENFEVIDMGEISALEVLQKNIFKDCNIGFYEKIFSVSFVENLQEICRNSGAKIISFNNDLIDILWHNKPQKKPNKIFHHGLEFSGLSADQKIAQTINKISADCFLLSNPESLCWLLNIRSADVEYAPLLCCYCLIFKNGEIWLFADKNRFEENISEKFAQENVELKFENHDNILKEFANGNFKKIQNTNNKYKLRIIKEDKFDEILQNLICNLNSIQIEKFGTGYYIYKILQKSKIDIFHLTNPITAQKAVKNKIEIENFKKAHEIDGLAVTKFLFWLDQSIKNNQEIDELICETKLLEFRQENQDFYYPSFRTISGFAENGAIIHYGADEKTNKKFDKNSLYLFDSGGQYNLGTTDITRTVAIGHPSDEMKHNFTLVLKGHIALSKASFDEKTSGSDLDFLARQFLLEENKNYGHGTGHGVGSFLSVHEGPVSISSFAKRSFFKAGMIMSNEPGYYKNGHYGIRIENLVLITQNNNKLGFEDLTLAPIDINLVKSEILNNEEIGWLKAYHEKIYKKFNSVLTAKQKGWLKNICNFYESL